MYSIGTKHFKIEVLYTYMLDTVEEWNLSKKGTGRLFKVLQTLWVDLFVLLVLLIGDRMFPLIDWVKYIYQVLIDCLRMLFINWTSTRNRYHHCVIYYYMTPTTIATVSSNRINDSLAHSTHFLTVIQFENHSNGLNRLWFYFVSSTALEYIGMVVQ